jgi:hypothetical protein
VLDHSQLKFDFNQTEGQSRRALMADFEFECSEILPHLYVGGAKVAGSLETLRRVGIRRIVNCSAGVVPNHFMQSDAFKYMSLNMVDGRDDDITWFVCQVLQFVQAGVAEGIKTLVHCEKGISRSCSFVIAYVMWSQRKSWSDAFNHVKMRRQVCNPNTAFTCNIMELNALLHGAGLAQPVLLRYAAHLPHDVITAVLKPCRDQNNRRLLPPAQSLLDPEGIFVLQQADAQEEERGNYSSKRPLYLWVGPDAEGFDVEDAFRLASLMLGVLSPGNRVEIVRAGNEPPGFWEGVQRDGPHVSSSSPCFQDLWPRAAFNTLSAISEGRVQPMEVPTSTLPADMGLGSSRSSGGGGKGREAVASVPALGLAANAIATTSAAAPVITALNVPPVKPAKPPKPVTGSSSSSGGARDKANATPSTPPSVVVTARRTPTPTLVMGSTPVRRTPPTTRSPQDVGLARGPTPVEEMKHNNTEEQVSRRLSVGSRGSEAGGLTAVAAAGEAGPPSPTSKQAATDGQDSLLSQHQRRAEMALQHAPSVVVGADGKEKPLLYVCTSTGTSGQYEWQAMGVYDDEDLVEDDLFMLFCPKGPHHVWIGTDFADMSVLELPTEAFKEWATQVGSGDCDGWVDLFPVDVCVELSGAESDEFWDKYSLGF